MKSLLFALAATLCACSAPVPAGAGLVTPATLDAAFAKAVGGDTLTLAPGSYGGGDFSRKFSKTVTITCADVAKPPSFRSLRITDASNLTFSCVHVDFTPDAKTLTFSAATEIRDSDHIVFTDMKITGGPAVAGLNEDGTGSDVVTSAHGSNNSGNIIGRPTAYGVQINHSSDVLVEASDISKFYKAVMLQWTQRVTLRKNVIHDNRTTAIVGADNSDLTIDGNYLHSAQPWAWGHGDHADLLALWSNFNQTTPNARVRIINNRMEQLQGEAILGMWFQGEKAAPFTDFEISGNQIIVNNLQGILINYSQGGVIANNRLYRASSGDDEQSPTVLLRGGVTGVTVKDNLLGAEISDLSKGENPSKGNTVVRGSRNIFKKSDKP